VPVSIGDRFIALSPEETRCPEKIRAIAPSAKRVYLLRTRVDCARWHHVKDCFHQVKGTYIVTEPPAARRYFTLCPKEVVSRLQKAGVW